MRGWVAVEAENGQDALAKLAEATPDLILLDLSEAERSDLNGNVQGIMQKGSCSVDQIQTAMRRGVQKPVLS